MSMISEQIKRLKNIKEELETNGELDCDISSLQDEWSKEIGNAIDTIETLSAKIQANNFSNSWIKCEDRLPESNCYIVPCFVEIKYRESTNSFRTMIKWDGYDKCWRWDNGKKLADKYEILAWQKIVYPEPYKGE